jgi:hypothetical protein
MAKKPLRAVADDERPAPRPESISAAADISERALLVALRDRLAGELDKGVPPHAIRGIVSELRDVDRSIRALDQRNDEEQSVVVNTGNDEWDQSAI